MSDSNHFDLIVLGAGPVGENVADYAHKAGLSVAIVESELVGGECSYWACMPSKALLRSPLALAAAQRVQGAREVVGEHVDAAAVLERRTAFTHDWDDQSQVDWLATAGIKLLRGHGALAGVGKVDVDGVMYTADAVAVATGSTAKLPNVPGIDAIHPWTTREATSAKVPPEHLIIVGGGVAAVELATAWRLLGSQVTMLVRSSLLRGLEPCAGDAVLKQLRSDGVVVHLDTELKRVAPGGGSEAASDADDTSVIATFELNGQQHEVHGSHILFATGRAAHTVSIGLPSVGLQDGDWLPVDDTMLVRSGTNHDHPWLYAVGDVNHRVLLTHQGKYQARAAGEVIAARHNGAQVDDSPWGRHVATADHYAVPQVVFTDPEVGHVGITEAQARDAAFNIRIVEYDLGSVAGAALQADGYAGHAKLVINEDTHTILGATFVGQDVAELVHAATIAIVGEVTIDRLWHAVPAYPTMSEVWLRLLEIYGRPHAA